MSIATVDEVIGRFAAASNATLLGKSGDHLVIYKPIAGNRPLWDFEAATLADREVLAYRISEALGFNGLVPETVHGDGPFGPGAVQRCLPENSDFDAVPLIEQGDPALWPIAVLDLIINNADRKAGHILADPVSGDIRAIDHGLCLHPDPKLRTVLWAFAGRTLPAAMVDALDNLRAGSEVIVSDVEEALGEMEAAALLGRLDGLLANPVHPDPPEDRPAVPWPLF